MMPPMTQTRQERILGLRSVRADGLRQHHLGREFVALGALERVTLRADGIYVRGAWGVLRVRPETRLSYYQEAP